MLRTRRPNKAARDGFSTLILHRDGTVTLWCVRAQQWMRGLPTSQQLTQLDADDCAKVMQHLAC